MKGIFRKLLALALCICLVSSCLPITVWAADETEMMTEVTEDETTEVLTEPYIIEEIESKRENNIKHFRISDGSYIVATYDIPVHYKDSDNTWQEYDNSLHADSILSEELSNVSSDVLVSLSKKAKQNKLVTVEVDGYEISWGYEKVNNTPITYENNTNEEISTELVNIVQEANYYDVYSGIDLQYFILPNGIKENIILKNNSTQKEFLVNYKIDSLSYAQIDSQTIELRNDEGKAIYTIKAPVMTDSAENKSDAVELNIVKNTGNGIRVQITVSEEWLLAEDRVYPVYIDPWVETKQLTSTIDSASLFSYSVASSSYPYGSLYVGRESTIYGRTASIVKTTLPTLSAGDMVVGAQLALRQRGYSGSEDVQVNVSKITSNWSETDYVYSGTIAAGYANKPTIASKIEDFNIANGTTLTEGQNGSLTYWDITTVVKGWYNGENNNGVMLWSNEPDVYKYVRYVRAADSGNYADSSYPVIVISYVNNNGLENYWTYHDTAVTSRGTAYVNDYTGNLVVAENIFNTTGNRMPMNISLVYNLRNYNKRFKYGASAGYGFMLNFQQKIDDVTDGELIEKGYKYIFTDADGTEHYFRQKEGSTTEWIDEEGLEITLKENGDTGLGLYLHYKDGSVSHFYTTGSSGVLFHTKDAFGNRIRYYSTTPFGENYGRLITSIEDGSGRTVTIEYELYNNIPRIKKITDNENRVYSFTYDTSDQTLLKSITYPDNTTTTYLYNSKRLSAITDSLGYKTNFTFVGSGNITKTQIKTVTSYNVESNTNYLLGKLTFTYNKDNTTTVTDYDGKVQTYQFDNYGRTTSIRYPDGTITNNTYHATNGTKTVGSSAPLTAVNNNKLISQNTSEKYVKNYIINSSAENSSGFYTTSWAGTANSSHSYDSTVAYLGKRSFKICNDSNDEYYNLYGEQIFAQEFSNSDYSFSAYVKTNNVVPLADYGAGLIIAFYGYDDNLLEIVYSDYYLTGTNDWTRISVSGHAPSATEQVRVYCGLREARGTAWFDCLQLETNPAMSAYNLVENSDFSSTTSWGKGNFASTDTFAGNGSATITGEVGANKYIYQIFPINKADICFSVFGTLEGDMAAQKTGRLNAIEIYICYSDGVATEYPKGHFNKATSAEQSISFTVKPKRSGVVVKEIGIYYIVRNTVNTTSFTNAMVSVDENGTSYSYDSSGNLISSVDNAAKNQAYEYNNAKELTKYTNDKNESYSYIYDSANAHKLTAVRSNQIGNGYTYSYDSYGNITSAKMGTVSATGVLNTAKEYISSATGYNSTGNYVTSETDTRNNTVTYNVNNANGLINSTTAPATVNGVDTTVTTSYTYDSVTRLIEEVASGNSSVEYTYDSKRRLSSINANGNTYTFSYDAYGNTKTVKIGTATLITYAYSNPRKALVSTATYGNGSVISYEYDSLDRLIRKSRGSTVIAEFYYNNRGQLAKVVEANIGDTTEYVYDIAGRLVQSYVYGNRDTLVRYKYDTLNRITSEITTAEGETVENTYTYGADSLVTGSTQGPLETTTVYDHLNRIVSQTTELNAGKTAKTEYTYVNGTSLVGTKKLYLNNVLKETLSYTYDKTGNIKTYSKNGALIESYTYDALNQLKTVTKGSSVYEYTYDNRGNILNVKLNGNITDTYTYGDTNWKDKLTLHEETDFFLYHDISYDNIGNPTNYRHVFDFDWQNGRTLAGVEVNDGDAYITIISDHEGKRINKDYADFSGGAPVNYAYEYNGTQLISQKWNGNIIRFLYDENGSPKGMLYNDTPYYYIKNLQGDITGIVDMSGNILGRYEYDVWGVLLSVRDASGNSLRGNYDHIMNINPLRYRGYYYDRETGLYLTGTRYYDPEIGRFINADSLIDNRGIITQNLFQYCGNNPVNNADPSGNLFGAIVGIGLLVIGMVATLSGCSSKPAATTSTPSTPSKPSTPSSSTSSTTPPHIPTPQEKSYAATVYAEAGGQNKRSKQAVAHVMNNRIGTRSSWTDIESVISAKYQFDGYNSPMYQAAMNYYNNGICNNSIEQAAMDECLAVVIPIYSGAEADITGGALYFHSFSNPSDWAYHNSYTQVYVSGTEKFWFYK